MKPKNKQESPYNVNWVTLEARLWQALAWVLKGKKDISHPKRGREKMETCPAQMLHTQSVDLAVHEGKDAVYPTKRQCSGYPS